jgi:hypothetical protein
MQQYQQAKNSLPIIETPVTDLVGILNKGMLMLGIKGNKLPTEFEIRIMVGELRSEYKNLPAGELDLAFTLAARNKLDEVGETYQNFSVLYLNRMMSAYARWALNKQKEIKPIFKELPAKKVNDDEIVKMAYDSFKKSRKYDQIFMALKAFIILHNRGVINTNPDVIIPLTESTLKNRITDIESKREVNDILEDDEQMELMCRRMALAVYFTNELKKEA